MIWQFKTIEGRTQYGWPVKVFIQGLGYVSCVYQFDPPAVVHFASGQPMCAIDLNGTGAPQEQARRSWDKYRNAMTQTGFIDSTAIAETLKNAPVVNTVPKVIT